MQQIAPGLWHWSAQHERIHSEVSSYYLARERVAIDAMVPAQGLQWFERQGSPPQHVLLSNRHHDRHAWRYQEAFGCKVHCVRNGMHELQGRGQAEPFDFGDELPGGIRVHEVDAICPDETALHIPSQRALVCADGLVRWPNKEGLSFVPDELMDEPQQTRQRLCSAYEALLELDFDTLLLAHGAPVVGEAKQALRAFLKNAD